VSADTPEMVELFQKVARRVGDMLRRPVVSYTNGREIVITFDQAAVYGDIARSRLSESSVTSKLPAGDTATANG
jgi:hypothetical protein